MILCTIVPHDITLTGQPWWQPRGHTLLEIVKQKYLTHGFSLRMWPYQVSILFCFCSALWLVLLEAGCGGCGGGNWKGDRAEYASFILEKYVWFADEQLLWYILLPFLIVALNDGYIYNRCGVVGSSVEMFHDWYSRKSFGFKSKLMLVQKLKRIFIHWNCRNWFN